MSAAFDMIAPHFRRMVERWPDAQTLSNHYQVVVESFEGNQHGLVETIKSFVECVCLTVLGEYGKSMPNSYPSTTVMLVEALKILGLQNSHGASKLDRILSAHNKLADALSDVRDEDGLIAHGKDGFLDTLTKNHIRAYLLTADTLLALLLAAFEGTEPDLQFTREPYERFDHLHDRIDGSVSVESSIDYEEDDSPVVVVTIKSGGLPDGLELRIEPSRLLYSIDRTAYIELLASSAAQAAVEESRVYSEGAVVEADEYVGAREDEPNSEVTSTYAGYLLPLVDELRSYVSTLNLPEPTMSADGADMIESILATAEANMGVDWRDRESLQSRMKVALRRTLVQFGLSEDESNKCAEHLVSWFKIQTVGMKNGGVESVQ